MKKFKTFFLKKHFILVNIFWNITCKFFVHPFLQVISLNSNFILASISTHLIINPLTKQPPLHCDYKYLPTKNKNRNDANDNNLNRIVQNYNF